MPIYPGPVVLCQHTPSNRHISPQIKQLNIAHSTLNVMPNTHRRRRRDETVLSRRVGGVYMNSQLAHDDC